MTYQILYKTDLGDKYLSPVTYTNRAALRAHTRFVRLHIGKDGFYFDKGRRATIVDFEVIYG